MKDLTILLQSWTDEEIIELKTLIVHINDKKNNKKINKEQLIKKIKIAKTFL